MTIRRVVTGHDADGVSVILSDGEVPVERDGGAAGSTFHKLWSTPSEPPAIEADEPDPVTTSGRALAPAGPGETLIRIVTMPPGLVSPMHRTATLDYGVVMQGTVHLVLDDTETAVGPGDVIVQRGTDHRWENRGDVPAQVAFVLIGATFSPALREQIDARARAGSEE